MRRLMRANKQEAKGRPLTTTQATRKEWNMVKQNAQHTYSTSFHLDTRKVS